MSRRIDISGKIFSRLTAIECVGSDSRQESIWKCLCECGNITNVRSSSLRNGSTQSCGCLNKELAAGRAIKHGHTDNGYQSGTYQSWASMKKRCYDPAQHNYERYGGSGIDVCESWLNSFENFLQDMGERPDGTSLDRIDSTKGYYPENCRWANLNIQAYNQRQQNNNTSGRTGVYFREERRLPWQASISVEGKQMALGSFLTYEEACEARQEAEIKYYGFTKE